MKHKPLKIGVTGGIGTGKTLVTRIFSMLGIPVYNSDERARMLMEKDPIIAKELVAAFGPQVFSDKKLNRVYMAGAVFNDPEKVKKVNGIVHPSVGEDFVKWVSEQNTSYVIKEAALLFEAGSYKDLDKVFTISSPLELRVSRIKKRDPHRSEEQIKNIISHQWSDEEKFKLSSGIIYNDESHLLIPQIMTLHKNIVSLVNKD